MQQRFFKTVIEVHRETGQQFVGIFGILNSCRIDLDVIPGRESRFDGQKHYGNAKQEVRDSAYHDIVRICI